MAEDAVMLRGSGVERRFEQGTGDLMLLAVSMLWAEVNSEMDASW